MAKRFFVSKFLLIMMSCLVFAFSCSNAFAWGHGGYSGHGGHGGGRYHYRSGGWYRSGWFGFDVAVSALAAGAVVESLPRGYTTVVVEGRPYYYYDDVYFRPCPSGYVVVPVTPPVIAVAPTVATTPPDVAQNQTLPGEPVVVNVPNSDGTFTPVTLFKHENGYRGPQGEFYPGHPTVEQLRALYGK